MPRSMLASGKIREGESNGRPVFHIPDLPGRAGGHVTSSPASRSSARAMNIRSSISGASPPSPAGLQSLPRLLLSRRPQGEHDGAGDRHSGQEIITKDNAMISTDGVVFFQVLDAAKAAYEVSTSMSRCSSSRRPTCAR
jgi:hypothetical protein